MKYEFTNSNGQALVARLILKGDRYGRNNCLVNEDKPMIEFNTQSGGHVSRYHLETFLLGWPVGGDDTALARGICLEGSAREYDLTAQECRRVVAELFLQLASMEVSK